jgi:GDP-D-mannose dehydratase
LIARQRRNLVGNAAKLTAATGWKPAVSFTDLVRILIQAEESRYV